ncbi:transposase IS4 family protein [Ammonifex degensii KC4]|uniref:Transposase IS4 family protein n=1 Tax=Ammonifex degensii (strain DSM 10501 / KC4) TaxID=429009 RepID=C9RAP8_AMMDK|nr:IS1182-like element ISAmde1 family transposase [Ammonifex degensii]ACX51325.1 transposase IS4 family protein [Ammonifex degensii KC4]
MMGKKVRQCSMFFGCWHSLIPENHFLRQVERVVDFSFIRKKVAHLYSHTGRPSIDPEVLIRILLIGYFYGITSERELMEQIRVNLAFREFIGYELDEEIPDHSTLSKNRHGRFKGTSVFQEIFDEIVRQCMAAGLVAGKHLSFDGTTIQANASYDSMVPRRVVEMSPAEYIQKVEQENPVTPEVEEEQQMSMEEGTTLDDSGTPPGSNGNFCSVASGPEDALVTDDTADTPQEGLSFASKAGGGKKMSGKSRRSEKKTNATHISRTDPDARIFARPGQPKKLGYIECVTVDSLYNIITGVEVIPGNAGEARVLVPMITSQMFKFGFRVDSVSGDKAHGESRVYKELLALGIKPFIPHQNFHETNRNIWPQEKFRYDAKEDCYICPNGKVLRYQGCIDRGIMKVYRTRPRDCKDCPYKSQCTTSEKVGRTIKRHVDARVFEYVDRLLKRPEAREAAIWRRTGPETVFGEAKEYHGLRRAKFRGLEHVKEQCLLTATAQNIKRMVKALTRRKPPKVREAAMPARTLKANQVQTRSSFSLIQSNLTALCSGPIVFQRAIA